MDMKGRYIHVEDLKPALEAIGQAGILECQPCTRRTIMVVGEPEGESDVIRVEDKQLIIVS